MFFNVFLFSRYLCLKILDMFELFLVVVQWSHLWFSAAVVHYSKVFLSFFQDTFGKILDMFEVQWSHLCFPVGRGALERRENTPSDRDLFDLIENRPKNNQKNNHAIIFASGIRLN